MNELALFSGYGGNSLALSHVMGARTVCHVECEPHAIGVLISRMESGDLDPAPIWDDVRSFDGRPWRGIVDIISGGFPCQDISVAGKGAGIIKGVTRSGLWYEYARIIDEVRPRYVFIENVRALLTRGIDQVLRSLSEMGYDAEWGIVSAADAGAAHRRERVFILGYTEHDGPHGAQITRGPGPSVCNNAEGAHEAGESPRASPPRLLAENDSEWRGKGLPLWSIPRGGPAPCSHGHDAERGQTSSGNEQRVLGTPAVTECGRYESMADSDDAREPQPGGTHEQERRRAIDGGEEMADAARELSHGGGAVAGENGYAEHPNGSFLRENTGRIGHAPQSRLGGAAHGTAGRLDMPRIAPPGHEQYPWEHPRVVSGTIEWRADRLKRLGNGVVPQQASLAAQKLLKFMNEKL